MLQLASGAGLRVLVLLVLATATTAEMYVLDTHDMSAQIGGAEIKAATRAAGDDWTYYLAATCKDTGFHAARWNTSATLDEASATTQQASLSFLQTLRCPQVSADVEPRTTHVEVVPSLGRGWWIGTASAVELTLDPISLAATHAIPDPADIGAGVQLFVPGADASRTVMPSTTALHAGGNGTYWLYLSGYARSSSNAPLAALFWRVAVAPGVLGSVQVLQHDEQNVGVPISSVIDQARQTLYVLRTEHTITVLDLVSLQIEHIDLGVHHFAVAAMHQASATLFAVTGIGLGFKLHVPALTIQELYFSANGVAAASLALDQEANQLFFGTAEGRVLRARGINFSGLGSALQLLSGVSDPVQTASLAVDGRSSVYTVGTTLVQVASTNCTALTQCTSCLADAYCSWCLETNACSDAAEAATTCLAPMTLLNQTEESCPVLTHVAPQSSHVVGGKTIAVHGSHFSTVASNGSYACLFGQDRDAVQGTVVSPTLLQCETPARSNAETISLRVSYLGVQYTPTVLTYSFYDCNTSGRNCTECIAAADQDECGFCYASGTCGRASNCTVADSWVTGQCPGIAAVSPPGGPPVGGGFVNITGSVWPGPADRLACRIGTAAPVNVSASSALPSNTLACPIPASVGGGTGSVAVQIEYAGEPITRAAAGYTYSRCDLVNTACDACVADVHGICDWCLDSLTCEFSCASASSAADATCPVLLHVSPISGSVAGGTRVTITGTHFHASPDAYYCRFGPQASQAEYRSTSEITCLAPPASTAGAVPVAVLRGASASAASVYADTGAGNEALSFVYTTPTIVTAPPGWFDTPTSPGSLIAFSVAAVAVAVISVAVTRKQHKTGLVTLKRPNFDEVAFARALVQAPVIRQPYAKDLEALETLITLSDMTVFNAIVACVTVTTVDPVAKALVYVLESRSITHAFISALIPAEVQKCQEFPTLFRGNSMTTSMFQYYSRILGLEYLWDTLAQMINEMDVLARRHTGDDSQLSSLLATDVEIDPTRRPSAPPPAETHGSSSSAAATSGDGSGAAARNNARRATAADEAEDNSNVLQLKLISQKMLTAITSSVPQCPPQYRQLCDQVASATRSRFPDGELRAVGCFVFLRFFCPAIASPHTYGLLPKPESARLHRQLVLVVKILLNLANGVAFGAKEPHMEVFNEFLSDNQQAMNGFLAALAAPMTELHTPRQIKVPPALRIKALADLHRFVYQHQERIMQVISTDPDEGVRPLASSLAAVLEHLGTPPLGLDTSSRR